MQSCSKPFTYAVCLNELGSETVHQYVGQEPSGRMFNNLCLDYSNKVKIIIIIFTFSYNIIITATQSAAQQWRHHVSWPPTGQAQPQPPGVLKI